MKKRTMNFIQPLVCCVLLALSGELVWASGHWVEGPSLAVNHTDSVSFARFSTVSEWSNDSDFFKNENSIHADFVASFSTYWNRWLSVLSGIFSLERPLQKMSILWDSQRIGSDGFWSEKLVDPHGVAAVSIQTQLVRSDAKSVLRLVFHEFTHLQHAYLRPHEEAWVREGVALLVESMVLQQFPPAMILAFDRPETSLVQTPDPKIAEGQGEFGRTHQYGHVLQFFYYLYRNCGKTNFLNRLIQGNQSSGIAGIDSILRFLVSSGKSGIADVCTDFKTAFINFERARYQQELWDERTFVYETTVHARILPEFSPLTPLRPYSSLAYKKPEAGCLKGDWQHDSFCVRVRLE